MALVRSLSLDAGGDFLRSSAVPKCCSGFGAHLARMMQPSLVHSLVKSQGRGFSWPQAYHIRPARQRRFSCVRGCRSPRSSQRADRARVCPARLPLRRAGRLHHRDHGLVVPFASAARAAKKPRAKPQSRGSSATARKRTRLQRPAWMDAATYAQIPATMLLGCALCPWGVGTRR